MKRLFSATINSLRAIGYGFRSEAALREEMIALVAALIAAVFIAPTVAWYVAMIASLLGLLVEFRSTPRSKSCPSSEAIIATYRRRSAQ